MHEGPVTDDAGRLRCGAMARKKQNQNECPICGSTIGEDRSFQPFCSDRCKKIDLGRWLDGRYVISRPIEQSDLEQGE